MGGTDIALVCSIIGTFLASYAALRNNKKDTKEETKEEVQSLTKVETKIDYISKGVDDIRVDFKVQAKEISDMKERLIKVEESSKSAHHRIDGMIKESV